LAIVRHRLEGHPGGWLLDGFPRNLPQAVALDELLAELNQSIELVVLMQLEDPVLLQRLLGRGRADDNEAVIRNRLQVYQEQTAPLIEHYTTLGLLHPVEASGTVEEIGDRIRALVE
jgi:adenylate kinase